ncbi:hypothetical protein [Alcaligenes faecalis]|uniref:Uncharacterized protein n=1 Tax=Alcaligenes faecalis TaxID=511 RepID=A0AAE9H507_ALCFA|nr:hypothetical protein [Alcaligenes faecalis]UPL20185.1 hypothetical protein MXF72_12195 [Alcaligenes faecalis]
MYAITISEIVSLIGLVSGVAGCVLGVMNYLRDRHKIVITLQWDLDVTPEGGFDSTKKWGLIRVTNMGRRPTYVSHIALKLPKGYEHSHVLIMNGIQGKKLTEGDPSEIFIVDQRGLEQYAKDWQKIIAQVNDSAGKIWYSKKLSAKARPSWAVRSS